MCRNHHKHHGNKPLATPFEFDPIHLLQHPQIQHLAAYPVMFGSPDKCLGLFVDMGLDISDIIMGLVNHDSKNLIHTTTDIPEKFEMMGDHEICGMVGTYMKMVFDMFVP